MVSHRDIGARRCFPTPLRTVSVSAPRRQPSISIPRIASVPGLSVRPMLLPRGIKSASPRIRRLPRREGRVHTLPHIALTRLDAFLHRLSFATAGGVDAPRDGICGWETLTKATREALATVHVHTTLNTVSDTMSPT
jgi:hypothetical protein